MRWWGRARATIFHGRLSSRGSQKREHGDRATCVPYQSHDDTERQTPDELQHGMSQISTCGVCVRINVCVCVCVFIYIQDDMPRANMSIACACMYVRMYVHVCTYVCVYVCMCLSVRCSAPSKRVPIKIERLMLAFEKVCMYQCNVFHHSTVNTYALHILASHELLEVR